MCRLALFNHVAVETIGLETLELMFYALDKQLGGDGMGVAALFPNGKVKTRKGVNLGPNEASHWIVNQYAKGATHYIFHTRMATMGSVRTANCHPFTHNGLTLAQNGQAPEYGGIDDRTDSEGVCLTIGRTGLPTSFLYNVSGVFVGFRDGKPFVVKGQSTSQLEFIKDDKTGAYLFASVIPTDVEYMFGKTAETIRTYEWYGEVASETNTPKKKTYSTKTYTDYTGYTGSTSSMWDGMTEDEWEDYINAWDRKHGYAPKSKKQRRPRYKKHSRFLSNLIAEEARIKAEKEAEKKAKTFTTTTYGGGTYQVKPATPITSTAIAKPNEHGYTGTLPIPNHTTGKIEEVSFLNGVPVKYATGNTTLSLLDTLHKGSPYVPADLGKISSGSWDKLRADIQYMLDIAPSPYRAEMYQLILEDLDTVYNDFDLWHVKSNWREEIAKMTENGVYDSDDSPQLVYAVEMALALAEGIHYEDNEVIDTKTMDTQDAVTVVVDPDGAEVEIM